MENGHRESRKETASRHRRPGVVKYGCHPQIREGQNLAKKKRATECLPIQVSFIHVRICELISVALFGAAVGLTSISAHSSTDGSSIGPFAGSSNGHFAGLARGAANQTWPARYCEMSRRMR